MLLVWAMDIEALGVLEESLIAIRRAVADEQPAVRRDRHTVELDISGGSARQRLGRRLESKHFFDGVRNQSGIVDEFFALIGT